MKRWRKRCWGAKALLGAPLWWQALAMGRCNISYRPSEVQFLLVVSRGEHLRNFVLPGDCAWCAEACDFMRRQMFTYKHEPYVLQHLADALVAACRLIYTVERTRKAACAARELGSSAFECMVLAAHGGSAWWSYRRLCLRKQARAVWRTTSWLPGVWAAAHQELQPMREAA